MSTIEASVPQASSVHPAGAARVDEPRIGELVGDRLCAKCCFNLSGQTIVREHHYGLLIVRCPECGAPAALQEYPLLGRWANRMGYVLGGAWLLVMLVLVVASALAAWGMAEMLTEQMVRPYAAHVQKMWTEHAAANGPPNLYAYGNQQAAQLWWDGLDKSVVFAEAGGWGRAIAWRGLWLAVNVLLLLGSLGSILAVAAPHVRWRGRLVLLVIVGVLGGMFWWMSDSGSQWGYDNGWWNARRDLRPTLGPINLGIGVLSLAIGLWMGRPLARGMVKLLLPPRMRGPLAYLWRADGKPVPGR